MGHLSGRGWSGKEDEFSLFAYTEYGGLVIGSGTFDTFVYRHGEGGGFVFDTMH